jgi:hypothetical protein
MEDIEEGVEGRFLLEFIFFSPVLFDWSLLPALHLSNLVYDGVCWSLYMHGH